MRLMATKNSEMYQQYRYRYIQCYIRKKRYLYYCMRECANLYRDAKLTLFVRGK